MKKLFSFILLLNISIYLCADGKGELLKGKTISSDAASETKDNAFDGDAKTQFQSTQTSYGWVGLELTAPNRITKIGWMPQDGESSNYLFGVFEGANEETFMDAFPLYMIKEAGKAGEMNYVDIDTTIAFKYLRYVGPSKKNCIIAGLEFYGYESSTSDSNAEEKLYQPTSLPVVIIHTENGVEPKDKTTDIQSNIIIVNKGKVDIKKKAGISLRGNSTKNLEKKPYKVKFEENVKMLDLPSNAKKWSLLANHVDKTLIRNTLGLKISRLFGMKYTATCVPVDLYFNGEFKGNYNLCEKIEVGQTRIEIPKSSNSNDAKETGYLLEINSQTTHYYTTKNLPYVIHYPDESEITQDQLQYIENELNQIEAEAYDGVVDKIDYDSFCKYILIGEFFGNPDIFWSTYVTKSAGEEKLYFGPVWDFDLSFGNDKRIYPHINEEKLLLNYGIIAGSMKQFSVKLLNNEALMQHLKDTWREITSSTMTKQVLLSIIDEQVKYISESRKLNFKRWDVLNRIIYYNAMARCTYDAELSFLKEYVQLRFDMIGKILDRIDTNTINEETKGGSNEGWGEMPGNWGGMPGGDWGGMPGGNGGWTFPGGNNGTWQGGNGGWNRPGGNGGNGGWTMPGGNGGNGGWTMPGGNGGNGGWTMPGGNNGTWPGGNGGNGGWTFPGNGDWDMGDWGDWGDWGQNTNYDIPIEQNCVGITDNS